jgi:DNA (cytosine-5)-methyltransferase 1
MIHGSLFAGIGGFDLGFERAGIKTVWQVEIDGYCRGVLAKHFPSAQRFADIRECGAHNLSPVDILSGGFPCQDISNTGKRTGIDGERSGLWSEYARIVRELRPRYVVVENVAALLGRGMERVLGDLAACGYDAEWDCIPAASVGAPHIRERVWILAYSRPQPRRTEGRTDTIRRFDVVLPEGTREFSEAKWSENRELVALVPGIHPRSTEGWWFAQSCVARSVNGIPRELVDARNGCIGNAIVPQIAEWIGKRIVEYESSQEANPSEQAQNRQA